MGGRVARVMIATGYLALGGAVSLNGAFAKMSAALEFIFFCLGLTRVAPGLGLALAWPRP